MDIVSETSDRTTDQVPASLDLLPDAAGSWPRTSTTVAAVELIEAHEPAYLVNHSVRTYFYGKQFAANAGLHAGDDYDDELLFLGSVLHDIGLTAVGNGTQRFEVDGADYAADFVQRNGLNAAAAEIVWDAVALHSSPGIAGRKRPEIAFAHLGSGVDIFEFGAETLDPDFVEAIHERYPRLNLREALFQDVADQIRDTPSKFVPFSFPEGAVKHVHPHLPLPGIPELIANCRWSD